MYATSLSQQYFYNTMMERHLVESREAGIDTSTLPPPVNPTAVFRHIDENVLPAPPCRGVRIHVPGDPIGMWVRAVPTEPRPQFDNTQRLHHLPENASLMYTETYQQRENRSHILIRTHSPPPFLPHSCPIHAPFMLHSCPIHAPLKNNLYITTI